jgi:hypothetical protein
MGRPKSNSLRQRQRASQPRVLERVESSRDAQRLTVAGLRELVATAEREGKDVLEVVVRRREKPERGKQIRLVLDDDGQYRWGPESSGDHEVENVGGYNFRAKWRTRDCARWLAKVGRT